MKTNLLKTLLAGALLLCGVSVNAQELLDKFYVGVTGYDAVGTPATIDATVYEDWSFVVNLADADSKVGANKADVEIYMQKVGTLGVIEKRQHKVTLETGVSVTPQRLGTWLPNTYAFKGTHVPVTVIDGDKTQTFVYCISGNEDGKITGTPCNVDETRIAWHMITDNVTSPGSNDGDSHIKAKQGCFLKIGNEKLTFSNDTELLKGSWTFSSLAADLQSELSYQKLTTNDKKAILYLPAGTELAVSGSVATLDKAASITLDCSNVDEAELTDRISTVLANLDGLTGSARTSVAIQQLLSLFDSFVGLVDKADVVPCEVRFNPTFDEDEEEPVEEALLTVYAGSEQPQENVSVEEFERIQTSNKNAIALADAKYASQLAGKTNIVIAYPAGKNGTYYECENLVLTDPRNFTDYNYYFPYDFTAVTGSYSRSISNESATCCVPFDLDAATLGGKILTFSYYAPIYENGQETDNAYVYFNSRESVNAGVPCFLYGVKAINMTFDNTRIVGVPDNSANLQGAFVSSDAWTGNNYYGIAKNDATKLMVYGTSKSVPFRSALCLKYTDEFNGGSNHDSSDVKANNLTLAIIGEDGEATTIDGVSLGNVNAKEGIYTINGVKVSDMSKPGLYIVNGIKKFVNK